MTTTTTSATLQDSVAHIRQVEADELVNAARRIELAGRIDDFKRTELADEFVPRSFEIAQDGKSFTGRVATSFGYGFMSFYRGERVTFNQNCEILY